jgi:hypothetical protein
MAWDLWISRTEEEGREHRWMDIWMEILVIE